MVIHIKTSFDGIRFKLNFDVYYRVSRRSWGLDQYTEWRGNHSNILYRWQTDICWISGTFYFMLNLLTVWLKIKRRVKCSCYRFLWDCLNNLDIFNIFWRVNTQIIDLFINYLFSLFENCWMIVIIPCCRPKKSALKLPD